MCSISGYSSLCGSISIENKNCTNNYWQCRSYYKCCSIGNAKPKLLYDCMILIACKQIYTCNVVVAIAQVLKWQVCVEYVLLFTNAAV